MSKIEEYFKENLKLVGGGDNPVKIHRIVLSAP